MEITGILQIVMNLLFILWFILIEIEIKQIHNTLFDLVLCTYVIGKDKLKEEKNETAKKK